VTAFTVLKWLGPPGSLRLLALCVALGVALRLCKAPKALVYAWFALFTAVHVVLALPATAYAIERRLVGSLRSAPVSPPFDTIIVLDGDNPQGRVAATLSLWQELKAAHIVVSGGPWLAEQLTQAGVSPGAITLETGSSTTREQIIWVVEHWQAKLPAVVVVASCLQAPRVQALLEQHGADVRLVGAPLDVKPPRDGWHSFVPSYESMILSRDALYEHAALAYYEHRRWISRPRHRDTMQAAMTTEVSGADC